MYCIQYCFNFFQHVVRRSRTLSMYQALFDALDFSDMPDRMKELGRKGYAIRAMIRALIVKHREGIGSMERLVDYLDGNPILAELCGFAQGVIPSASVFYRLLDKLPPEYLQRTMLRINNALIDKGAFTVGTFLIDSKPVLAAPADNNIKNAGRNLTDKTKKPARNPRSTLGYLAKEPNGGKRMFRGYRAHVITTLEGIPLIEVTLPNNVPEAEVARRLIKELKRRYRFESGAVFVADAAYDVNALYELIVDTYKGKAFIARNPRAVREAPAVGEHSRPLCEAGLEMGSDGRWIDRRRHAIKHKFICPLKAGAAVARRFPDGCPAGHPKFDGYGCTKYRQQSYSARDSINRDSEQFKRVYAGRIAIEQYFARLGTLEAFQTTHYNLKSIRNQLTIAHLTHSLVALVAVSIDRKDLLRCHRSLNRAA